jgi:hypothetical protein
MVIYNSEGLVNVFAEGDIASARNENVTGVVCAHSLGYFETSQIPQSF